MLACCLFMFCIVYYRPIKS